MQTLPPPGNEGVTFYARPYGYYTDSLSLNLCSGRFQRHACMLRLRLAYCRPQRKDLHCCLNLTATIEVSKLEKEEHGTPPCKVVISECIAPLYPWLQDLICRICSHGFPTAICLPPRTDKSHLCSHSSSPGVASSFSASAAMNSQWCRSKTAEFKSG